MSDLRQAAEQALQALEELQYAVTTTAKADDVVLYYRAIVALRDALRWQSYPASSPSGRWEDDAWCAECGVKLEPVRPGRHQHPICSQAAAPLVETLREALEALLGQRGEPGWHTGKQRENAIAALRERLGEKEQR